MDALTTATATAPAVGAIGGRFMLDGETYKRGAELGFQGLDFYVTGRGGVLGEVDADVVSAAFTFFEPGTRAHAVGTGALRDVAQRRRVGVRSLLRGVGRGARARRLRRRPPGGARRTRSSPGARPAWAPVFAGWRALPVPCLTQGRRRPPDERAAGAAQRLHGAAVVSAGLTPLQALSVRSPQMVAMFGWAEAVDTDGVQPIWETAEAATNRVDRPRLRLTRRRPSRRSSSSSRRHSIPRHEGLTMADDAACERSLVLRGSRLDRRRRTRPPDRATQRDPRRARAVPRRRDLRRPPGGCTTSPSSARDVERTTRFYAGPARLPSHHDVREPRPARAPPTSSSTSATATPSRSSICPASIPAAYAEVLGGLHHLAISMEVTHWEAAKVAPRRRRRPVRPRRRHLALLPRPRRRAPRADRRPPSLDVRRAGRLSPHVFRRRTSWAMVATCTPSRVSTWPTASPRLDR